MPLLLTCLSAAARSTRVTRWSLLDGDFIGGPFQILPGKAKDHLLVVAPYFLCPGCGSGGPYPGHIPFELGDISLGRARPISQDASHRMPIRIE